MILLILSNFLLKKRIHCYFCRILIFAFLRFFIDQTDGFFFRWHFWRVIDKYKKSLSVLCDSGDF